MAVAVGLWLFGAGPAMAGDGETADGTERALHAPEPEGVGSESWIYSGIPGDDEVRPWGELRGNPYYPGAGLQSPFRKSGIHLGGDAWIDTGYEASQKGLASQPDQQFWLMQGRFMLDVTATRTHGRFFAQAKAQLLAHVEEIPGDEHIDTDDAWIRFGIWDLFDLQVGRFEAWEVYHKGEGLERDTLEDLGAFEGPDIYEVNYAFYRQNGFGQLAAHLYATPWLRFEVASVFGNELGFNSAGVRTSGILDFDWVRLNLAGEYRKLTNQDEGKKQWEEKRGLGGGLQFKLGEPTSRIRALFGANAAYGVVDKVDGFGKVDEKGSPDTLSVGGFANLGLFSAIVGLGYNHTIQGDRQWNSETGDEGLYVLQQAFASVRHPLYFQWLTAKVVFAWAKADLQPAVDNHRENDMYSVRLRLNMVF